jgi:glutamine synthetase adenylyltransferase
MVWGQWRVPELSEEDRFDLRVLELQLLETVERHPRTLVRMCVVLSEQCRVRDNIINKASKLIAELEASQAIAEPPAPQRPQRRRRRWLWRGVEFVRAVVLGQ